MNANTLEHWTPEMEEALNEAHWNEQHWPNGALFAELAVQMESEKEFLRQQEVS